MRKTIELPESVIDNLEKESKEQKRSLKAHMEYCLINQGNRFALLHGFKK